MLKQIEQKINNDEFFKECEIIYTNNSNITFQTVGFLEVESKIIDISISTQESNVLNLSFLDLKQQLEKIFELLPSENYNKIIVNTDGNGEPFLNLKNVEDFAKYCLETYENCEFHLYSLGINNKDSLKRCYNLSQKYANFYIHINIVSLDQLERSKSLGNSVGFLYLKLSEIVDFANRLFKYSNKKLNIEYLFTGKETELDFNLIDKQFGNCIFTDYIPLNNE